MQKNLEYPSCASWIEVSQSALKKNIEIFRNHSQGRFKLGVVLKGNAYGHGSLEVFSVVHPWVDCIYLITAQDAFEMRKYEKENHLSRRRMIVIGAVNAQEAIACARNQIEVVIGGPNWKDFVKDILKAGVALQCHIHMDTGLSREGFVLSKLKEEILFLKKAKNLIRIQGVMSHFANTEDVTEQAYALSQVQLFEKSVEILGSVLKLNYPLEKHIAASAATLMLPSAHFDMVRVGISLYGFWPSAATRISTKMSTSKVYQFIPALSWKCESQTLKKLKKGTYVGYGCTYRAEKDMSIAVFPVGYFDGYPRIASGKAHVLIKESRCPVIGRIMMNHIVVDVTEVWKGEDTLTAVLIGKKGKEIITAEHLADWGQTIHYEIVTRLGSHLKRILVK